MKAHLDDLTASTPFKPAATQDAPSEADQHVVVIGSNSPAAPTPTTCLTECSCQDAIPWMPALSPACTPTPATAIGDTFPEHVAPVECDDAIDFDTTSVTTQTPTTYSTDCSGRGVWPLSAPSRPPDELSSTPSHVNSVHAQ